jgi:hypothetical protein
MRPLWCSTLRSLNWWNFVGLGTSIPFMLSLKIIVFVSVLFFLLFLYKKMSATRINFKCDSVCSCYQWNCQCSWSVSLDISLYLWQYNLLQFPEHGHTRPLRVLQIAVNHLLYWAVQNEFSFSAAKTKCLHLTWLQVLWFTSFPHLFFHSKALLFAPLVKFLGLLLGSKFTGEPHVNCEFSLSSLKVSSGQSWDGDQEVMLDLTDT